VSNILRTRGDKENKYMKIQIEYEVTQDMIENVIVSALEGGSNYWYFIDVADFEDDLPPKGNLALTERISEAVYKNPAFKMPVYDVEDEDDVLGYLSQKNLRRGLELCAKDYPEVFQLFTQNEIDAGDADVIFQLTVMGEVTFG
jgi:hypothetical protein